MAARALPAASLVAVWRDERSLPHIFMGRRHAQLTFMPDYLVFPGGRLEQQDRRTAVCQVDRSLDGLNREARANFSAQAYINASFRECLEETGLDLLPHVEGPVHYIARAITPPDLPRRYDTRFFLARLGARDAPPEPFRSGDGELLEPGWLSVEDAYKGKLHPVTRAVLAFGLARLNTNPLPADGQLLIANNTPRGWHGLPRVSSRQLADQQHSSS